MKQGALIFDERSDRYDIRFDLADYYGGLHCGETFDVMVGGRWKPHPHCVRGQLVSGWHPCRRPFRPAGEDLIGDNRRKRLSLFCFLRRLTVPP